MLGAILSISLANATPVLPPAAVQPLVCPPPGRDESARTDRADWVAGKRSPTAGLSLALIDFRIGIAESDPVRLREALKTLPARFMDGVEADYIDQAAFIISQAENDTNNLSMLVGRLRKLASRSTQAFDPQIQFGRNRLLISALILLAKTQPRTVSVPLLKEAQNRVAFLKASALKDGDELFAQAGATADVEIAQAMAEAFPTRVNFDAVIALQRNFPVDIADSKARASKQLDTAMALAQSLDLSADGPDRADEAMRVLEGYERARAGLATDQRALNLGAKRAIENLTGQWRVDQTNGDTACLKGAVVKETQAAIGFYRLTRTDRLDLPGLINVQTSLREAERAFEAQPSFRRSSRAALLQAKGWRMIARATTDVALKAKAVAERDAAIGRGFEIVRHCFCFWEYEDLVSERGLDPAKVSMIHPTLDRASRATL